MPPELTVEGMRQVVDAIERNNREDHRQIRGDMRDMENRLCEQMRDGFTEMKSTFNGKSETQERDDADFDRRLKTLENWRWYLAGIGAVVILLLGVFGTVVVQDERAMRTHMVESRVLEQQEQTTLTTTTIGER